jgi:hypothetical protein
VVELAGGWCGWNFKTLNFYRLRETPQSWLALPRNPRARSTYNVSARLNVARQPLAGDESQ